MIKKQITMKLVQTWMQIKYTKKNNEVGLKWVFTGWAEVNESETVLKQIGKYLYTEDRYGYKMRYDTSCVSEYVKTIEVEVEPNTPFDTVTYDSEINGFSMFSDSPVNILGEQKMLLEDGRVVEQYVYTLPHDQNGSYISIKANIIIT